MSGELAEGFAAGKPRRAPRAFRIFLAVAVVCVAQVSWWIIYQMRQADLVAELRKAELELRSLHIALELNDQVSALWDEFNEMASDSTWTGAIPRRLMEHPMVLAHNRSPTVTRRIQSPFGHYDLDNWTWVFRGASDSLWVTLDPQAVARAVELIDPEFEFRGEAALPGALPYPLDPPPVRPTVEKMNQMERDRGRARMIPGAEAVLFLLVTVVGVYLIYRTR